MSPTASSISAGFKKYAAEIVWESEVWIASNPDHMIHFKRRQVFGTLTTPDRRY